MNQDYLSGALVKIIPLSIEKHYWNPITGKIDMAYNKHMRELAQEGCIHVVERVQTCQYGYIYRLAGKQIPWAFTKEFLKPVEVSSNKLARPLLSLKEGI